MNPLTCTRSLAEALRNVGLPTMSDPVAPEIALPAGEFRIDLKWSLQYFLHEGKVYQLNAEAAPGLKSGNYRTVVRALSDENAHKLVTVFVVFGFVSWLAVKALRRDPQGVFKAITGVFGRLEAEARRSHVW